MYNDSTVLVKVTMPGTQSSRGSHEHFNKVDQNGKQINGVKVLKSPSFSDCHETVRLGNAFVKGALTEPPTDLKDRYKLSAWRGLTENKRIAISVDRYVKAMHPDHRGYAVEIL
jgi:hypothetical protein